MLLHAQNVWCLNLEGFLFPLQHELRVVLMGHTWPRVWPVPIEESPKAMMKDLAAHSYPTISHMKGCKPTCL